MYYQCYDIETGEILCTYNVSPEIAEYMEREQDIHLIEGEGANTTHYVDISEAPYAIKLRPEQLTQQDRAKITSDGQDLVTLSGLPVPCSVRIGNDTYSVDDSVLEWSTLMAGHYDVRVLAFPYRDFVSEVVAVEG